MDQRNGIRIDVVGDADGFGEAAQEATRELDGLKRAAEQSASGMRGGAMAGDLLAAAGSAVATAGAIAGGAVTAWAAAQVAATFAIKDTADEVGKLAQRMGESVTSVSELRYAFGMAGADAEQMAGLMKSLENRAQDAARGVGSSAAAYRAMGISVVDANGDLKDGRVLLEEVADRISGYRDGAAKAALVNDALGGSWVKLIPLLNGGAEGFRETSKEAHELGVVFSEELTKQSADLNDNLTRIKAAAEGAKIALGSSLMPTVRALTDELIQGIKAAGGFWAALSMGATLNPFKSNLDNLREVRGDIAKMEADQKEYDYLDEQRWNRKQAQLKYLLAMQGDMDKRGFAALSDGLPTPEKPNAPTPPPREPKARKVKVDDSEHKANIAALREAAKAEAELMAVRRKADDLIASYARQDAMTVQRIARSAELALMTDRERIAAEAVYRVQDESARRQEQIIKQIGDEATRTRALAEEKALLANQIDRVREASLASFDQQRTFEFGWRRAFQSYSDEATNAALQGERLFTSAADAMADAGTRLAMRQKVNFGDIARSFAQMMIQMQMRAAAAGLTNSIGGFVSGLFGPTTRGAGTATENWIDSGGLAGARASGGPVAPGKKYLVGERGPEVLRMGSSGGTVVPNEALGGGPVEISMTVINQGAADGYQAKTQARNNNGKMEISVLFVKEFLNDLQNGGPMGRGIQNTFGLGRSAG